MANERRMRSIQAIMEMAEVEDAHYALREGYLTQEMLSGLTESERGRLEHTYLALVDFQKLLDEFDEELSSYD